MSKFKKIICSLLILVIGTSFSSLSFAEETTYVWSNSSENTVSENTALTNSDNSNSLNLESASAILMEQSTGQILYSHNIHEQLRPASVTKVMSILLIMEALDSCKISLTDNVPCSENAASMGRFANLVRP